MERAENTTNFMTGAGGGWWFLRGGRGEERGQSRGFYMEQEKVGHSLPFDSAWNDVFGLRIVKNERAVTT